MQIEISQNFDAKSGNQGTRLLLQAAKEHILASILTKRSQVMRVN
jgi:hypothetical protein